MLSSRCLAGAVAATFMGVFLCTCACSPRAYASSEVASSEVASSAKPSAAGQLPAPNTVKIPGPLRSFLRMAGISQQARVEEVIPLMARNSYLLGYEGTTQTEFLRLLNRYIHQARELEILAGANQDIHVANCIDAAQLLRVLGYRLRGACGDGSAVLETANATRAFLTTDSGFPLTELEEALQKGVPFDYPYSPTFVPVLFSEGEWAALGTEGRQNFGSLLDTLTNDPMAARLYWALARMDAESSASLERSPGLHRLLPLTPTLDFYGSQLCIRSGRVSVPGGTNAEPAWKEMVGANPDSPGEFVTHLLQKDDGWLAVYFDALSRLSRSQQEHLTEPARLRRLYEAFRAPSDAAPATRGVFPRGPDLLVLLTRLQFEPSGQIEVPGGLDTWKEILRETAASRQDRDLAKRAHGWDRPEQLLEALVAASRMESDNGPVQIYLTLSQLDSGRPAQRRLSPATALLLANKFSQLGNWYLIFNEFPALSDDSISRFVAIANAIEKIPDQPLRGNVLGSFQANIGLWQILARQGELPDTQLDSSWRSTIDPFAKSGSPVLLLDAAHASLEGLLTAATGKTGTSPDEIVDLLAGPQQETPDGQQVRAALAARMKAALSDQRLVSFDTLFSLSDGLHAMAQGKPASDRMMPLAEELRDFEMPRQIFTKSEKVEWAPRANTGRHAELQVKTDLTRAIKSPGNRAQLEAVRGQLAPLLRDALVGLNYAYYEPPGAQILHINPLLVRSHDFIGTSVMGAEQSWKAPTLLGVGVSAGGGAYLLGSLADLPYSLATAEQDMISPENVQALIWKELVPELLTDAVLVRWWSVTPNELHAVALYQRFGEDLLRSSAKSEPLRSKLADILADRMEPGHLRALELSLQTPNGAATVPSRVMPADTFYLGTAFRKRFPAEVAAVGPSGAQLDDLCRRDPAATNWELLSKDFGIPHPTLARTYSRELLNVRPFPFYGGYSSRLFGERWESGNLYWARLADEMGYSPTMLNRLVPELTRHMVAKIFATDLEDWPSVLRAMQQTGEDFRTGKIVLQPVSHATASSQTGSLGSAN